MVFPEIPGHIPGGGGGEDQQGIDDHQAHPAHGQGDHHGDGDGEQRLIAPDRDAPGGGQLGMDRGEHQPVGGEDPQHDHRQQHRRQQADFPRRHRENVADQILVELGEGAAVHGGDEDTQGHGGGGEDADDGLGGLVGAAFHVGEEQGEGHGQGHGEPGGRGRAAEDADGDTGEARVAQGVGEEAHPARDHHGGQEPEQRPHNQHGQQGVFHKVQGQPRQRQPVQQGIPEIHRQPPPMWKTWSKAGDERTSRGDPWARTWC